LAQSRRDSRGLDELDREILGLLREDGRMPYQSLGAAVGLSANAVADRVRRMRRDGVITGFTVVTSPAAAGDVLEALVDVRLDTDQEDDGFEAAMAAIPEVLEDLHLTGPTDHQLRLACRDIADLNRLLRALRRVEGVQQIETRVILNQAVDRRAALRPPP
jgi:Lrp/AsnC family leucine-responsive transcriptional regulator